MTSQLSLFAPTPAELRDAALERVARGTDPQWMKNADRAVVACAHTRPEFSSDDVWATLELWGVPGPHEPRALGPVMMRAVKDGTIVKTGRYVQSELGRNHARPVAVYRGAWR